MNHYTQEFEPLEELLAFRDSFRIDYLKCKKMLDDRKEQLFKS
jgi:hypothetical protein